MTMTGSLNTPLSVQHVLFSPSLGIYMGNKKWSYDKNVSGDLIVPVFKDRDEVTVRLVADGTVLPMDAELREVWPSKKDGATQDDCANALLPRWS
jgi:hypothetical protein